MLKLNFHFFKYLKSPAKCHFSCVTTQHKKPSFLMSQFLCVLLCYLESHCKPRKPNKPRHHHQPWHATGVVPSLWGLFWLLCLMQVALIFAICLTHHVITNTVERIFTITHAKEEVELESMGFWSLYCTRLKHFFINSSTLRHRISIVSVFYLWPTPSFVLHCVSSWLTDGWDFKPTQIKKILRNTEVL